MTRQVDDEALLRHLGHGAVNVKSSYDLALRLGVRQRSVGFIVSRLRQAGHLIGSIHAEGYYLIETEEELFNTLEHIERRKRGIDKTINALTNSFAARQAVSA